jgi:hypothetical protein
MPKAPAGDEPPENEKTRGDHEGHRGFDQFLGAFSGLKRVSRAGRSAHLNLKRPWMAFSA